MTTEPGALTASARLIFGTDGIRDRAGAGLLTADGIERVVAATAYVLLAAEGSRRVGSEGPPRAVLVGRDTRGSGADILSVIQRAFTRRGLDVIDVGVLTTPGVAFAGSIRPGVILSVMISASHNPAEYNGIKFFSPQGAKVSDAFERTVSDAFFLGEDVPCSGSGRYDREMDEAFDSYVEHLVRCCRRPERVRGAQIALDAANGAGYRVGPEVFRRLGAVVTVVGAEPDGTNINESCGALHPDRLARVVAHSGAAIGFCLDGDGDRMIPVGARGSVFDGDHVLYLVARDLHEAGALPASTVVATSMSNFGLEQALLERGIHLLRTDVGDRNVYDLMVRGGYVLGGEQSGHTIFLEDAQTGDGILSALRLIDSLGTDDLDLEEAASSVPRYPQRIENVRVREKVPFESLAPVTRAMETARAELDGCGRIVLRYSGTEPLARVMVESDDAETTARIARAVARAIESEIGD